MPANVGSRVAALESALPRLRAKTPAAAEVAHFNHAGDSPSPRPVLDVVQAHLEREALIGGYEAEDEAADRIDGVYASIGRLLNASLDEIAIVENATRAWDMALYAMPFAPGDRILTSVSEYGSNAIAFIQVAERTGALNHRRRGPAPRRCGRGARIRSAAVTDERHPSRPPERS